MRRSGKLIAVLLILLIIAASALGVMLYLSRFVRIGSELYPTDLEELDLRGQEISVSEFEKFHNRLPECQIYWNVPVGGQLCSSDSTALNLAALTDGDIALLGYFPRLETLTLETAPALSCLRSVRDQFPNLQLHYQVSIGGTTYPQDTAALALDTVSQADLEKLPLLSEVSSVTLSGADDLQAAAALQNYCAENGLSFGILLGDTVYAADTDQLQVTGITDGQLALLGLLPNLKSIHLTDPAAAADSLLALRDQGLNITWEKTVWGLSFRDDAVQIDLSEGTVGTLEEVEAAMAYLPDAEHLFLGFCQLDNEAIAAFRERSRDQFKVVWVVDLSGKMQVRTDIDNFMPSRDGWGYVRDHEIDNIRYCEDLICIDIGHMGVKDVSFLETLVNLEYLILAHTEVQYVDPIVNCKKLKYLELDWSCIRDVSPLVELTALEDLNLGMTWPDITPILQMTWLKNLYLIKGNCRANFAEALPDTRVVTSGDYTVSSGWRQLPNYYAMRDILGMHYM